LLSYKNRQARHKCLTPVILATWEAEIRRIKVRGQLKQNSVHNPIYKITRAKWAGGVAQVVECLLCKNEANFKPQSLKRKDKQIRGNQNSLATLLPLLSLALKSGMTPRAEQLSCDHEVKKPTS
jgi:hypothetical protein